MNLDNLLSIVRSATKGPWHIKDSMVVTKDECWVIARCPRTAENNQQYIATFHPKVMKAILLELIAARKLRECNKSDSKVSEGFRRKYDDARAATDSVLK